MHATGLGVKRMYVPVGTVVVVVKVVHTNRRLRLRYRKYNNDVGIMWVVCMSSMIIKLIPFETII